MTLRPNRVQKDVCLQAVSAVLGEAVAESIGREIGLRAWPLLLPVGPRSLEALAQELQPFVDLYRALLARTDRETALGIARQAIIQSGLLSHANDATQEVSASEDGSMGPLNLTSPPPPGSAFTPEELLERFRAAMDAFSCEGQLLAYGPDFVRFQVTGCNWCKAMEQAGTPELIPFICETDERFMDLHQTHKLYRPTAIGLGDRLCDFQFVRREPGEGQKR